MIIVIIVYKRIKRERGDTYVYKRMNHSYPACLYYDGIRIIRIRIRIRIIIIIINLLMNEKEHSTQGSCRASN